MCLERGSKERDAETGKQSQMLMGQEFHLHFQDGINHADHASDHVTTQLIDCTVVTLSLLPEPFQNAVRVSTAIDKS